MTVLLPSRQAARSLVGSLAKLGPRWICLTHGKERLSESTKVSLKGKTVAGGYPLADSKCTQGKGAQGGGNNVAQRGIDRAAEQ